MSEFATIQTGHPDDFTLDDGPLSLPSQYTLTIGFVAVATLAGFILVQLVTTPSLTLVFVLPVVISATVFGWGPSLAATVAGVLAFDFFFTEPKFSFAIASPADIADAALLLVIAGIVSAVAATARRRTLETRRVAEQAQALQSVAHAVIEARPEDEIAEAAAVALSRMFRSPAAIFQERAGSLILVARAGAARIESADADAARAAAATHTPTRADSFPVEAARFDFWPVTSATGAYVLGVDFSELANGRPRDPERLVEIVGAYLAASLAKGSTAAAS